MKRNVRILLLTVTLLLSGCGAFKNTEKVDSAVLESTGELRVHYIDVGQGDATLLELNQEYMLIDAGDNSKSDVVVEYLKGLGVKKLEYVIGTHPHADHIGGLDDVIRNFQIETLMLPPIAHTTKTFSDVLDAIEFRDLEITKPVVGEEYGFEEARFTILGPNDDYKEDLNNWSIALKVEHGKNGFLFTGDAETQAEQDIMKNGLNINSMVLQAGHHGSSTSSSVEFLQAVSPELAIISCGIDNKYGHPHKETIQAYEDLGIEYLTTKDHGTIIITSDGDEIK